MAKHPSSDKEQNERWTSAFSLQRRRPRPLHARLRKKAVIKRPKGQYLRWYEDELDRGQAVTVREVIDYYWQHAKLLEHTRAVKAPLLSVLRAQLGHLRVSDLDAIVIRKYAKYRADNHTPMQHMLTGEQTRRKPASETVLRDEIKALRAAILFAIRDGIVEARYRPVFPVIGRSHSSGAKRFLSRPEAARMLKLAYAQRWRHPPFSFRAWLFLNVALFTGARRNAIEKLRWKDVDLEARTIDFTAGGAHGNRIKRRVKIKMMPELYEILKEVREMPRCANDVYVLGDYGSESVYKSVRCFLDRIGLKDVTPHTLRHTWATWAVQDAVPSKQAADYLGMSEETFRNTYAHHDPNYLSPAYNRRVLDEEDLETLPRPNGS